MCHFAPRAQSHGRRHDGHGRDRPRQHDGHQRVLQRNEEGRRQGEEGVGSTEREWYGHARANSASRASRRFQTYIRLRDVRGAARCSTQRGQGRPKRQPPHRVGKKRTWLPQPRQACLQRMDRRFLHASAHRPRAAGALPRRPHCLLRLHCGRSALKNLEGRCGGS